MPVSQHRVKKPDFQFSFSYYKGTRQYIRVYLDLKNSSRLYGRFDKRWRNRRNGLFGDIHISRNCIRRDTFIHECQHAWIEWMWANRIAITSSNEERLVILVTTMIENCLKAYERFSE